MVFGLAFPNDEHIPSEIAELALNPLISQNVVAKFRLPVFRSGLRTRRSLATKVAVPKASMNEHDLAPSGKDEVRRTRQVLSVQTETIAERMGQTANAHFRARVLATNSRHERAALRIYQWFAHTRHPT